MNRKTKLVAVLVMVVVALLMGAVYQAMPPALNFSPNNTPTPGGGQPTQTPYPTQTPWPTQQPTYTPTPTPDLNYFQITQRSDKEYVSTSYYQTPTSYHAQPLITAPLSYTHAIGVLGTYKNWNFDVYVQVGGDIAFWSYATSGMTDENGLGYANVAFSPSNAGQVHTVVAVLNPNGGSPVNYGGFTAGELSNLVADGTLRQSNHLSFDVIANAVL